MQITERCPLSMPLELLYHKHWAMPTVLLHVPTLAGKDRQYHRHESRRMVSSMVFSEETGRNWWMRTDEAVTLTLVSVPLEKLEHQATTKTYTREFETFCETWSPIMTLQTSSTVNKRARQPYAIPRPQTLLPTKRFLMTMMQYEATVLRDLDIRYPKSSRYKMTDPRGSLYARAFCGNKQFLHSLKHDPMLYVCATRELSREISLLLQLWKNSKERDMLVSLLAAEVRRTERRGFFL